MAPEKKLIYQVFCLLKTHTVNPLRKTFSKSYVMSISDFLTIDLKRTVLENSMNVAPSSSANSILGTPNTVIEETTAGIHPIDDEEMEASEVIDNPVQTDLDAIPEYTALPDSVEDFSKKKMHVMMFKDPWEEGRKLFAKKDVLNVRAEQVRRLTVRSNVRRCIQNGMQALATQAKTVVVGLEMTVWSEW